ncbi:MAG: histidinol dehydrogenase [Opitutales bacterium]
MRRIDFSGKRGLDELRTALVDWATGAEVSADVAALLAEIRSQGDDALLRLTERFDQARLEASQLRVPAGELAAAEAALAPAAREAMEEAIASVRFFHGQSRPQSWLLPNPHGAEVGERYYPLRRVGLYIPGGQAPLVSTVIMTAVPAVVAGCREIVVCTPPRPDGSIDAHLLAALSLVGVEEVYRLGGVQAIGGMAYGTDTVPAVDKLFGPGNAYVNEAKRQLFGVCGVDLLPGPSEVLVIADAGADPAWVAADLIAQAEHGTHKEKVFLVTLAAPGLLAAVEAELAQQAPQRRAAAEVQSVLDHRAVAIEASTVDEAVQAANLIAPEHLELLVGELRQAELMEKITTAGAFLLGYQTPTVLGDFVAGPSHTLPTDTTARFSGGIQTVDFMRRSSVVRFPSASLAKVWPTVKTFAELERLDGHGESLRRRVEAEPRSQ